MALEISKTPDLWRWRHKKMPIYGVGDTLKLPYYGVGNLQNTRFMALEIQKMPIYGVSKEILITFATS